MTKPPDQVTAFIKREAAKTKEQKAAEHKAEIDKLQAAMLWIERHYPQIKHKAMLDKCFSNS